MVQFWVFEKIKVEKIKTLGLLQPLSIPSQRLEEVSMDFIIGLPKSEGKIFIMVVVIHLKPLQLLLHLFKQFKSYMETKRLL